MLELINLTKKFILPYGQILRAVNELSFVLSKGDFTVVVGPNGAGKSTLFDLIAGRVFPDLGCIKFGDTDITSLAPHRRAKNITLISQTRGAGLPKAMTVKEVMGLALEIKRTAKRSVLKEVVESRLESLEPGLSRIANSQIWHLSGGEYQLVSLSVATILCEQSEEGNHIVLFDEHVSQLAPGAKDRVLHATSELLARRKYTAMFATHSPDIATRIGNRQIVMAGGQVIGDYSGDRITGDVSELREILKDAEKQSGASSDI